MLSLRNLDLHELAVLLNGHVFHVLHLLKQKFPEDAASSGNNKPCGIFFHPDFTVGTGITPVPAAHAARGLYRRSGISPCPEDNNVIARIAPFDNREIKYYTCLKNRGG